jgi:ABC-type multidrug transport system ATPase subunit/ABC-type multidrug transport system permease subunit
VNGDAQAIDQVPNVATDAAVPPELVKETLMEESKGFMTSIATFKQNEGPTRRGESFFDTVSRRQGATLDKNVSLLKLSKIIQLTIEWKNLTYIVPIGKGKKMTHKTILDDLSGQVPSSRLLAVMGPTGSGKTSLINALAGRLQIGGTLEGEILVNGQPRGRAFRSISAYVMQDDILFSNLTVKETFTFAANMRLPADVSHETKSALVTQIITELGLSKAENTRIGNEFFRGVSGGERKRTNIGIELLSGASLIFLDEPTSGLDAFQAQNVMESLWTLAGGGRTVLSTIHQPRSSIYKMFDLLLLLSEGRVMYFGPAKDAVSWFSSAGFPCPAEFNPADFFLDVVSMDYRTPADESSSRRRIQLLGDLYGSEGARLASRQSVDASRVEEILHANEVVAFPNGPFTEFGLLLSRSWKQQSRDRLPQIITIFQTIVIGFVLAALYSNLDQNDPSVVQDTLGILFFVCIFSAFGAMFGALNSFPTERGIVNRERAGKMYHVFPYYLARFICDIPLRVGQGLLFGCIVYWIVGLNPNAGAFFIFCCILIVEGLAAQGLGVAVSAGARNEKVALALAPAVTVVLILFGGFYVNEGTIPVWLSWIKYLSHLYWAFMALTINNFAGREGWACPTGSASGCTLSGDQILGNLHFDPDELWLAFVGLIALIIGYNGVGYILLRRSKPKYLPLSSSSGSASGAKAAGAGKQKA